MTIESRELALYTLNNGELYRGQATAIIANMARKMKQGKFDKELAVKAFEYLASDGAKMYTKEFGTPNARIFSKADRIEAAKEMLEHYMEQITEQSK